MKFSFLEIVMLAIVPFGNRLRSLLRDFQLIATASFFSIVVFKDYGFSIWQTPLLACGCWLLICFISFLWRVFYGWYLNSSIDKTDSEN